MAHQGQQVSLTPADISGNLIHVHDLPQLYTKPSADALRSVLRLLQKTCTSFDADLAPCSSPTVDPVGIPRYLTTIISSSLRWLPEHDREQIWEMASVRLSERSGRSAQPSMTRSFQVQPELTLQLYEPSLTEDSLGLKTWTSSWLLAKRLDQLSRHVSSPPARALELGAGTGLVGLTVASVWQRLVSEVLLTDLPEIIPNLNKNIDVNRGLTPANVKVHSRVLDWSDESDVPADRDQGYQLILAADPIYSVDHPRMFTSTVERWLHPGAGSRFILELPLRQGYDNERQELRQRLQSFMEVVEEGEDVGHDDWEAADGRAIEVRCWWSVWQPRS